MIQLVCTLFELPGDLIIIVYMLWKVMSFFSLTYTSVSYPTSWHWSFLCVQVMPWNRRTCTSESCQTRCISWSFFCAPYRSWPEPDELVHQKAVWPVSYIDRFSVYLTGYDLNQTNLYISKLFEHLGRMVFEEVDESDKYSFVIIGVDSALGERLHFQQVTGVFSFVF